MKNRKLVEDELFTLLSILIEGAEIKLKSRIVNNCKKNKIRHISWTIHDANPSPRQRRRSPSQVSVPDTVREMMNILKNKNT